MALEILVLWPWRPKFYLIWAKTATSLQWSSPHIDSRWLLPRAGSPSLHSNGGMCKYKSLQAKGAQTVSVPLMLERSSLSSPSLLNAILQSQGQGLYHKIAQWTQCQDGSERLDLETNEPLAMSYAMLILGDLALLGLIFFQLRRFWPLQMPRNIRVASGTSRKWFEKGGGPVVQWVHELHASICLAK